MIAEKARTASECAQVELQWRRLNFELTVQELVEKNTEALHNHIIRTLALPSSDIEHILADGPIKRVRGVRGREIAFLADTLLQAGTCAVVGFSPHTLQINQKSETKPTHTIGALTVIRPRKKAARVA